MNKLLLVASIFMGSVAQADVTPEDIFGNILDIIQDQINKDKKNDNNDDDFTNWQGNKLILKDSGNKIVLGRVFIDSNNGVDSVDFPKCNLGTGNQLVTQVRFVVKRADVHIDDVRITFQNGQTHTFDIDESYTDGDKSEWFDLTGEARCIKKIRVRGEVQSFGFEPGWGNGNGGVDFADPEDFNNFPGGFPGFPGNPGDDDDGDFDFEEPSVITFVGLKA